MRKKVIFCWSGGKDSALALHRLLQSGDYDVTGLLTTFNEYYERVSMHGVREKLIEQQAAAIGIPLVKMFVSQRGSDTEYAEKMKAILTEQKARGIMMAVFGDIFLEDLKRWRETNLAKVGMHGIFPLWRGDSRALVQEFVAKGFRAKICCVDDAFLGENDVGRELDAAFVRGLPSNVDPCGENGEFHSFVYAGPIFKTPLRVKTSKKVYRPIEQTYPGSHVSVSLSNDKPQTKGFWFCDLIKEDI